MSTATLGDSCLSRRRRVAHLDSMLLYLSITNKHGSWMHWRGGGRGVGGGEVEGGGGRGTDSV